MGIIVGTNSWVTLAEADSYMDGKFDNDGWTSLSSSNREKALITAFYWILDCGRYNVSASTVSDKLDRAQIELAWYVARFYADHQKHAALNAQGVQSFSISKWAETLKDAKMPAVVDGLLEDSIVNAGGVFFTVEREL